MKPAETLRPARICTALLKALQAAEGRKKQRKRNQTPDTIGLDVKRELLARVVADDPEPHAFDAWLMHYVHLQDPISAGAAAALSRAVLEEWRLAHSLRDFAVWLEQGAPSADAEAVTGVFSAQVSPATARAPDAAGPGAT